MADETGNTAPEPKRSPAWALIGLGIIILVLAGWRTIATADIWTHIAIGRDVAHHGIPRHATLTFALPADAPWTDTSWLYDLVVAGLWKLGGAAAITLGHIAAVVFAFVILALATWHRGNSQGWAIALAIGVAALLLLPSFSPEPIVLALVFPAIFLSLLARGSIWKFSRIALPLLQVLWTNMHPSFLLGPVIALFFTIDAWLEERRGGQPEVPATPLIILTAALAFLTLVNPYGFGLHGWLLNVWLDPNRNISLDTSSSFSAEFVPTILRFSPYAAVAIVAIGLIAIRQRLSIGFAGAAAVGAFLLVRSGILTPLSAALIMPFVAMSFTAVAAYIAPLARVAGTVTAIILVALAAFVGTGRHLQILGLASNMGLGIQRDVYPAGAIENIGQKSAFPERALNFAADGGFLATRLPGRPIYCDSRGQLYGGVFYERLAAAMLGDSKTLREIETAQNPGAIILNCTWPLAGTTASTLVGQGRWALAYFDGTTAVFLRNTVNNLQFLRDRNLQKAGLEKIETARREYASKIGSLTANPNCARLIGAGHVFIGMGRFREAEVIYRLLTQGAPNMHSAWLGLGIAQENLGRHTDAAASLRRAVKMRLQDPLPLLWLSRACRSASLNDEAADAEAGARALDAGATEAFLKKTAPRKR